MIGQPVGPGGGPLQTTADELVDDEELLLLLVLLLLPLDVVATGAETGLLTCDRMSRRSALFLTRKKRPVCRPLCDLRPFSQIRVTVKTANVASNTVVADTKTAVPAPEHGTEELSTINSSMVA